MTDNIRTPGSGRHIGLSAFESTAATRLPRRAPRLRPARECSARGPLHRQATMASGWVKVIRRALDAAGCDGAALCRQARLDLSLLNDVNARYPADRVTHLWHLAREATDDSCFGLRVASHVTQTTFHALGYTLIASANLKEAFERVARHSRVTTDEAETRFERIGDEYHLSFHLYEHLPQPAHESLDAFVSAYVRMCRSQLGRDFSPLRIEMQRPEPRDSERYCRILRTPLVFRAPVTRIVFDRRSMEIPLDSADAELASHNDAIVLRWLARLDKEDIVARVKAALVDCLPHGEPSQEAIADSLHMSARSLQRKLADESTTYTEVLDMMRRELALSYLRDPGQSVSTVTFRLGFSDTSSFTRAFRRWTGSAPSAWKAQLCSVA